MSLIAVVVAAAVAAVTRRPVPGVAAGVLVWLLTSVYLTGIGAGDEGVAGGSGSPLSDLAFVLIQLAILGVTIAAGFVVGRLRQPSGREA